MLIVSSHVQEKQVPRGRIGALTDAERAEVAGFAECAFFFVGPRLSLTRNLRLVTATGHRKDRLVTEECESNHLDNLANDR